jgi:hypothetical protein
MSGRIGFGSRTHAFVAYEVIVSIVRANRYRPGAEEGRIPGKGGKANLPHWAPRMTLIVILCEIETGCRGCRCCG